MLLASYPLCAATEALMASTARIDELKKKFDENPRRYFAPLANEFRKAGDIEQAILICEEFLPQQPGHMSGHIVYGQALYEAGRLPEARGVFETALGLDPENLIALRHLGDIARGQADAVAARTWYARVLDADPRNEEIQALLGAIDAEFPRESATDQVRPDAMGAADASPDIRIEMDPVAVEAAPPDPLAPDVPAPDASSADASSFGSAVVPPPLPPSAADGELLDGFSMHGFDATSQLDTQRDSHAAAEGLESTSFEPPREHIPTTEELDDSLDSGVPSFAAPSAAVQSLDGLQGSGGMDLSDQSRSSILDSQEFTPLELDDTSTQPPSGDPFAHASALADAPAGMLENSSADLMDLELPTPDAGSHDSHALPADSGSVQSADVMGGQAGESAIPSELPPEVIAAEAGLLDESQATADAQSAWEEPAEVAEPVSARAPFVTETMAELYAAQGLRDEARGVYEQLLAANPGDARLTGLVAAYAPATTVADTGPSARDFFARLAARRPAGRSENPSLPADDDFAPAADDFAPATDHFTPAADDFAPAADDFTPAADDIAPAAHDLTPLPAADDFAPAADASAPADRFAVDAPHAPEAEWTAPDAPYSVGEADTFVEDSAGLDVPATESVAPEPEVVAPAIERAAAMLTPDGSISALFGNRTPGTSEDSAAAALSQAFGGEVSAPPGITGRPAHAASGELSLDSVFRDGAARPPRTSQSFSFDQFFTGAGGRERTASRISGERAMPVEAPAERSAEEVEKFNSWLQGLKPQ